MWEEAYKIHEELVNQQKNVIMRDVLLQKRMTELECIGMGLWHNKTKNQSYDYFRNATVHAALVHPEDAVKVKHASMIIEDIRPVFKDEI